MPVPAPVTMATFELEVMSVFLLQKCDRSNQDRCRGLRLLSWSLIVAGPAGAVKDRVTDFSGRPKDSFSIFVRRLPVLPPCPSVRATGPPSTCGRPSSFMARVTRASPSCTSRKSIRRPSRIDFRLVHDGDALVTRAMKDKGLPHVDGGPVALTDGHGGKTGKRRTKMEKESLGRPLKSVTRSLTAPAGPATIKDQDNRRKPRHRS